MLSTIQKTEIKDLLAQYVKRYPSQAKAAKSFTGVSEANVIQILKENWGSISTKMWYTVANQVGFKKSAKWQIAPIKGFKVLSKFFEDSKTHSTVYAIIAQEGFGKSETSRYADSHPQTFYIECAEYLSKKLFLSELSKVMGLENSGSVGEMMEGIVRYISSLENPLIIMDEADKLPDKSLSFFITLCNKLQDRCGIILMGTDHLQKKILKGVKINRQGYKEIFSRIGRKFIEIPKHAYDDVKLICEMNECEDPEEISIIYNQFDGDLRRVKRMVHAYKTSSRKTIA